MPADDTELHVELFTGFYPVRQAATQIRHILRDGERQQALEFARCFVRHHAENAEHLAGPAGPPRFHFGVDAPQPGQALRHLQALLELHGVALLLAAFRDVGLDRQVGTHLAMGVANGLDVQRHVVRLTRLLVVDQFKIGNRLPLPDE